MIRHKLLVTELALVLAPVVCVKHGPPPLALEECDPAARRRLTDEGADGETGFVQ